MVELATPCRLGVRLRVMDRQQSRQTHAHRAGGLDVRSVGDFGAEPGD